MGRAREFRETSLSVLISLMRASIVVSRNQFLVFRLNSTMGGQEVREGKGDEEGEKEERTHSSVIEFRTNIPQYDDS